MWLPVYDHVQRMPKTETTTHCCNIRYENGSLTHFVVQPSCGKLIPTAHICPCLMKHICVVSGLNTTACIVHGARPKTKHREATDRFSLPRDFAANSFFLCHDGQTMSLRFPPSRCPCRFLAERQQCQKVTSWSSGVTGRKQERSETNSSA